MKIDDFKADIHDEVSAILDTSFKIEVTATSSVPHNSDGVITFPNVDEKTQGIKVLKTTVLYVDMRRSTQLSLKHDPHTVAKLYSAFIRAMTRCAGMYGGHVRGIIGDRVMILFDERDCFKNAVNTGILINSVCKYVIDAHFDSSDVSFGIGIDYGSMLAAKTGIRRHGSQQSSYRALVWLGRPANVASKLTDNANKPKDTVKLERVKVAYKSGTLLGGLTYKLVAPWDFVKEFGPRNAAGVMPHKDPSFYSFTVVVEDVTLKEATPSILMSKRVFDGFKAANPTDPTVTKGLFKLIPQKFDDVPDEVYGGSVVFSTFRS